MSIKRKPRKGDLVICVVSQIQKHGVYVELKEYPSLEGYIHVSEVTGAWVRNIRNFVRQGQQVVGKVTHINRETGQINLSLKRVSDQLKKDKVAEFKKQNSALALISIISEKVNMSNDQLRELIEPILIQEFGSLYNGFEEITALGPDILVSLGVEADLAKQIHESAEMSIQINTLSIVADLGIRSYAADGVEQVKKLLAIAENTAKKFPEVNSSLSTIGSPQYRLSLEGRDIQELSEVYSTIEKELARASKDLDVQYKIVQQGRR